MPVLLTTHTIPPCQSVPPRRTIWQVSRTDKLDGLAQMGKAKPAKHTSAELAAKAAAALTNKGGGAAGKQDRLGGKVCSWQRASYIMAGDGSLILIFCPDLAAS